jgi:hypothetical protein
MEMTDPVVLQVHPLSEVRQRLSGILARFRREGAAAEPVAFGSHRKPEAILLPYEVYERYEALSRQRARLDSALASAQSVQAELPGPFSPDHDREVRHTWTEIGAANCTAGQSRYHGVMPQDPYSDPVTGVAQQARSAAAPKRRTGDTRGADAAG